eukprot:c13045_g2_i1 orf=73-234(+)
MPYPHTQHIPRLLNKRKRGCSAAAGCCCKDYFRVLDTPVSNHTKYQGFIIPHQ